MKKNNWKNLYCDFETAKVNDGDNPSFYIKLAGFYNKELDFGDVIAFDTGSINNFIEYINIIILENNFQSGDFIKLNFLNSSNFDGRFIIDYLVRNFNYSKNGVKSNNSFSVIGNSKLGWLSISFKYKNIVFKVFDYLKIEMISINSMANQLGLSKYGENEGLVKKWYNYTFNQFEDWELELYKQYCLNDCKILADYMCIRDSNLGFNNSNVLTSASLSLNKWKILMEKEFLNGKNSILINELERIKELEKNRVNKDLKLSNLYLMNKIYNNEFVVEEYFEDHYEGGLTIANPIYVGVALNLKFKKFNKADSNSAYPSVMVKGVPVIRCTVETEFENCEKLFYVEFIECRIKKSYTPCFKDENRELILNFKNNFKKWVWEKELDIIKKIYNIKYLILDIRYYYKLNIFESFVNEFYPDKVKASKLIYYLKNKDKKNVIFNNTYMNFIKENSPLLSLEEYEFIKLNCKLFLNSLYGKFGQKKLRGEFYFSKNEYELNQTIELIGVKEKEFYKVSMVKNIDFGNYKLYEIVSNTIKGNYFNNIVASFITMSVRLLILDAVYRLKDKFVYSDTDSVMAFDVIDNYDEFELGKWKNETPKDYEYLFIFGPKKYMICKSYLINSKTDIIVFCGGNDFNKLNGKSLFNLSFKKQLMTVKKGKKSHNFGIEIYSKEINNSVKDYSDYFKEFLNFNESEEKLYEEYI